MCKITLDNLMTDFFDSDDTVTVNANDLQSFIREKNQKCLELEKIIENLSLKLYAINEKQKSNYTLDLKV